MPHRDRNKQNKKNKPLKLVFFLLFIVATFIGGYLYTRQDSQPIPAKIVSDPEFTKLENPDSTKYTTVVSPHSNVEILTLSRIFYQEEVYWSYILQANPELDNLLNIPAGTVIKIPKVDSLGTENSLAKAKLLGDKLLSNLNQTKK